LTDALIPQAQKRTALNRLVKVFLTWYTIFFWATADYQRVIVYKTETNDSYVVG